MKKDLPFDEIAHLMPEVEEEDRTMHEDELAGVLFRSVFPVTGSKPQYNNPELWKAVDSKQFNLWRKGALRFIEHLNARLY